MNHRLDPSEAYRLDALSPITRFDEVETTISHLFRRPHPALSNRTYGSALYAGLRARGLLDLPNVLELGGGAGFVASAMTQAARAEERQLHWTFLELSKPLVRLQRQHLPSSAAMVAHAERLPLRSGAHRGLFLANEVIADLRVVPLPNPDAKRWVERLGLAATENQRINVGALELVAELGRVLAAGSAACLIEFGGDFPSAPIPLEGPAGAGRHVEHSIHFSHLETAAKAYGFATERLLLADFLGIDRATRVASYPDLLRLRRFVPGLPILAHPKESLEAQHPILTRLFRIEFPQIGSPRFPDPQASGGLCQLFHALILRR